MTEQERLNAIKSFEKKYKLRPNFKKLFERFNRQVYKDDILQPMQRRYRDVFKKQALVREAADREAEFEEKKKEQELNQAYLSAPRHVTTIEQKTLRELHHEHPTMVSEEDIIKWPTKNK